MIRIWKSSFWSIILRPISILYRLGLTVRNLLFEVNVFSSVQLNAKVISVGNVTVGGTGKTPCVESVAQLLKEKGYRVAVLSRGFGRRARGIVVVSDGDKVNATVEQTGDEPMVLAKNLSGIPVIVGKNRAETGQLAIQNWQVDVLLLDDAFHNRKVKKDFDIVVMDSTNLWGNGRVLPAGPLREPLHGLQRADTIILSRVNERQGRDEYIHWIRRLSSAKLFSAVHKPVHFVSIPDNKRLELSQFKNKRGIAFAGIGNPDSFQYTLRSVGVNLVDFMAFHDHHRYKPKDFKKIFQRVEMKEAEVLVTTEKDYVRLPLHWNPPIQTIYLKIEFEIQEGSEELIELLDSILKLKEDGGT